MNGINLSIDFLIAMILLSGVISSIDDEGDELIGIPERGTLGYHYAIRDSGVTFQWRRSKDGGHEMSMSSQQDGYVAVGFCDPMTRFSSEGMENCDIALGWVENFPPYTPRLVDMFSKSEGVITEDRQTNYQLRPGSEQYVNHTMIKFKRQVDTEDALEDTILSRPVIIIWAWNENDPVWDTTATPPRIQIATIVKHRSKENEVYQAPSRGHTPITVLMDYAIDKSSASAIDSLRHLLVLSNIVLLCRTIF